MTQTPDEPDQRPADDTPQSAHLAVEPGSLRRAPRLGRFIMTGVLLGALLAAIAALVPGTVAAGDLFWLVFFSTGLFGAVAGAIVYWILDRRSLRRARSNRK